MTFGIAFRALGVVTKVNEPFQPQNSAVSYHSFQLGLGDSGIRINCSSQIVGAVNVGDQVQVDGSIEVRDNKPKFRASGVKSLADKPADQPANGAGVKPAAVASRA